MICWFCRYPMIQDTRPSGLIPAKTTTDVRCQYCEASYKITVEVVSKPKVEFGINSPRKEGK